MRPQLVHRRHERNEREQLSTNRHKHKCFRSKGVFLDFVHNKHAFLNITKANPICSPSAKKLTHKIPLSP